MADRLEKILLERILLEQFKHSAFLAHQREVIEHMIAGGDALAVMPTGSGKSLLYQVPALVNSDPTLVLSPLIALMKDQVDALLRRGIAASFVNSTLTAAERERRTEEFVSGRVRILYVTPERFRSRAFLERLPQFRVGLLAVDEAHCVSEWGHDFRPDYSRIHAIRDLLHRPPTIALTATATPVVQQEILRLVGIPEARIFQAGIDRPNLFLSVTEWPGEAEKTSRIAKLWDRLPGAGIVYGALIRDLHGLEQSLSTKEHRPLVYHGELSREERRAMQETFMAGAELRVLATNAFGMGVDKADIRSLLHFQVPGSVESYYQEIGRAGRDGAKSYCELCYCESDLAIQMQFVEWANPERSLFLQVAHALEEWGENLPQFELSDLKNRVHARGGFDGRVETCLQWLEVLGVITGSFERHDLRVLRPLSMDEIPPVISSGKRARDLQRLLKVVEYVRTPECRRAWLTRYFGLPSRSENCDACDRCADREEWLEAMQREGQGAVRSVVEVAPSSGPRRGDLVRIDGRHLGRVLRVEGSGRRRVLHVELSESLEVRKFRYSPSRVEVL